MSADKRTELILSMCTRNILAACSEVDLLARCSTKKARGSLAAKCRAVSVVKPERGYLAGSIVGALSSSSKIRNSDVRVEATNAKVTVYWL